MSLTQMREAIAEPRQRLLVAAQSSAHRVVYEQTIDALLFWLCNVPAARAYYSHEYGAVTYAIDAARNAAALVLNNVFMEVTTERRVLTQPQYAAAAVLSTLAGVLALPTREIIVRREDRLVWDSLHQPISDFCSGNYSVEWSQPGTRVPDSLHASWVSGHLFFNAWQSVVSDATVRRDLVCSLLPDVQPSANESVLKRIVREACLKAVGAYKTAQAQRFIAANAPNPVASPADVQERAPPSVVPSSSPAPESNQPAPRAAMRRDEIASSPAAAVTVAATPAPNPAYTSKNVAASGMPPASAKTPEQVSASLASAIELVRGIKPGPQAAALASSPPRTDSAVEDRAFLSPFASWMQELLRQLRAEIEQRSQLIRSMQIEESGRGFMIARGVTTNLGISESKIISELVRTQFLIEKHTKYLVVKREIGEWLTQKGEFTVGATELAKERAA